MTNKNTAILKDIDFDFDIYHQKLENTIDRFLVRIINTYETKQVVRDSQFARLLVWAKKVSKKTGIPLEDF